MQTPDLSTQTQPSGNTPTPPRPSRSERRRQEALARKMMRAADQALRTRLLRERAEEQRRQRQGRARG